MVCQVQGHRVPLGLGLVGAADPAARVIGPERGPRALPQLERGQRLPLRVEAVHLGQLPVPEVGANQAHHAARLHRAELGRVPDQDQACAGPPREGHQGGQVLGADLGRLVNDHDVPGPELELAARGPVLAAAEGLGHVVRLGQALGSHDVGRVGGQRDAHHPAAGDRRPGPRVRGHDVCLARARRGHQHGHGGPRREEPGGHLGLVRAEARARQGHVRRVRRDQLGHLAARLGQQPLLQVQLGLPWCTARPPGR